MNSIFELAIEMFPLLLGGDEEEYLYFVELHFPIFDFAHGELLQCSSFHQTHGI